MTSNLPPKKGDKGFETIFRMYVGDFTISELGNGIVMLENVDGEGVQITPKMLDRLFRESF